MFLCVIGVQSLACGLAIAVIIAAVLAAAVRLLACGRTIAVILVIATALAAVLAAVLAAAVRLVMLVSCLQACLTHHRPTPLPWRTPLPP